MYRLDWRVNSCHSISFTEYVRLFSLMAHLLPFCGPPEANYSCGNACAWVKWLDSNGIFACGQKYVDPTGRNQENYSERR